MTIDDEPSSRTKFKELANKRVNQAAKVITNIGNLSNRSNYSYEEKEVERIFKYLRERLKKAESRFQRISKKDSDNFSL
jgi:hypothetical protein